MHLKVVKMHFTHYILEITFPTILPTYQFFKLHDLTFMDLIEYNTTHTGETMNFMKIEWMKIQKARFE